MDIPQTAVLEQEIHRISEKRGNNDLRREVTTRKTMLIKALSLKKAVSIQRNAPLARQPVFQHQADQDNEHVPIR